MKRAQQERHPDLVQRRLGGEVEYEALGLRKARQPNPALHVAALAIDALQFAQPQQIARVIGAILRRFHGDLLILARECGKLQGLEMIAQQHLGRDDRRGCGLFGERSCLCPRCERNGA